MRFCNAQNHRHKLNGTQFFECWKFGSWMILFRFIHDSVRISSFSCNSRHFAFQLENYILFSIILLNAMTSSMVFFPAKTEDEMMASNQRAVKRHMKKENQ